MGEYDTMPWERRDITLPELADAIDSSGEIWSADADEIAQRIRERSDEMESRLAKLEAVAAKLAAGRFLLRHIETLILIEAVHEKHYDDHGDHKSGERFEDCSGCRWLKTLNQIQHALKEPTNG